jgi:hypothetical protein
MTDPHTPEALKAIASMMRIEGYRPDAVGVEALVLDNAANEIERLIEKCNKQAMILRRLSPEQFPDTYFIHGELGAKDDNGMPDKLLVVPAYGVDFSYVYVRSDKVVGPEW